MKLATCLGLLIVISGCAPVGRWPTFQPVDYSAEEGLSTTAWELLFACDGCLEEGVESRICVAVHAPQKAHYGGGRTPDGRRGVVVPVQFDYTNHDEVSRILPVKDVRLIVGDERVALNVYYSETGKNDFIPPGGSRTLILGFVVPERVLLECRGLVVECPCPGPATELLRYEFAVAGKTAAAPN